jgi:hypothetical protein
MLFNFFNNKKNYIIENFNIKSYIYDLYLYYLRFRIKNIKTTNDIITIFKNINFCYKNVTCDQLSNIIGDCIKQYPLDITEIQKSSLLQQENDNEFGIENYVTFVYWICILDNIIENEKKLKNDDVKQLQVVTKQLIQKINSKQNL